MGYNAATLHGGKGQEQRDTALAGLKAGNKVGLQYTLLLLYLKSNPTFDCTNFGLAINGIRLVVSI